VEPLRALRNAALSKNYCDYSPIGNWVVLPIHVKRSVDGPTGFGEFAVVQPQIERPLCSSAVGNAHRGRRGQRDDPRQIPLSRFDAPLPPGAINLGAPFVTAGRLVLIASTIDPFIRTFASSPIQAA
jgi:hypothetical protein